jgi:hypothetical protein
MILFFLLLTRGMGGLMYEYADTVCAKNGDLWGRKGRRGTYFCMDFT